MERDAAVLLLRLRSDEHIGLLDGMNRLDRQKLRIARADTNPIKYTVHAEPPVPCSSVITFMHY